MAYVIYAVQCGNAIGTMLDNRSCVCVYLPCNRVMYIPFYEHAELYTLQIPYSVYVPDHFRARSIELFVNTQSLTTCQNVDATECYIRRRISSAESAYLLAAFST